MNIKKTEFSVRPEFIINEGKTALINANIEEVERPMAEMGATVPDASASGNTVTVWLADSVRVEQPLSYAKIVSAFVRLRYSADEIEAIVLNGEDDSDLQHWREEAKVIARTALGMSDALECAKALKIADIAKYDTSSAVNGFTYGGEEFWLPRETRVSVMNTANVLKASGVLFMDLWLGSVNVNLAVDQVIAMLGSLEQYAFACYNITAEHKAAVMASDSVEAVMAYNITAGYPAKLEF